MYQALYRKWRPVSFDDVCGQNHITDILRYETAENRISHAYLFCGPRGTGKTTCAKILAKAINCHSPINGNPCGECEACRSIDSESTTDVLEMDAASNNGVDAVRAIRDEVNYTPSGLKYRVYIVDEVHMLSISAFNALLKTLEEPPAHVVFILATTELQKLPATIISRCQRFDFRRISTSVISDRLLHIASAENIDINAEAARVIARHANGGMRDAISLLDLCSSSGGKLDAARVEELLGISSSESIRMLSKAVLNKDYSYIFSAIHNVSISSVDIAVFWQDILSFYRDMLVVKTTANPIEYIDCTTEELESLRPIAEEYPYERLLYHIRILDDALAQMQRSGSTKRIIAELTFIRMCDPSLSDDFSAILTRVSALEEKVGLLAIGAPVISAPAAKAEDEASTSKQEKVSTPETKNVEAKATSSSRKPIPYWLEIVENLSKEHRSAMGLRNGSRAYKENDRIIIKVSNSFTIKLMSEGTIKSALAAIISSKEGIAYSPDSICFELSTENDTDDNDLFDTLI
ncbi:MAG: DNA polymerase III subunit gamma/tau [Clostridia bacterium]|nr:DNA polymerase III subunit gamma/tau [Clostridia bacterium]